MGHGGFSRGYGSMIQMVLSRKFAVIVLTNKSGETMRKSLNRATELGLGLKDGVLLEPAPFVLLTSAEMNDYVGTYSHNPQTWEVSVKDGKLFVKADGKEDATDEEWRKKVYLRCAKRERDRVRAREEWKDRVSI